jgi:hypothetical protein
MPHGLKYEALVSAASREQAIEIALEAMAPDKTIVSTHAEDVSASEGPGSYRVTVVFRGGARKGELSE